MLKIAFCITGSFCSMEDMLFVLKNLSKDYKLEIFISPHVQQMDTRFYKSKELIDFIKDYCSHVYTSIQEAEVYGPLKKVDAVVVYPCDGNTLAKLDLGINDNCVTMIVKSSLRNGCPIVLGVYTNDLLANSGVHFMSLLNKKNYYFVPLYQDHYLKKPNSVISKKELVKEALENALDHKQVQPLLLGFKEIEK